jgi:hypothetical protein
LDLQSCDGLIEAKCKCVVISVADRPEGLWVRMIFHVPEIFETFFFIAVAIHEIVFIDFEDMSEEAKEGQEDVVVDMLNPYILASPNQCGTGHEQH